MNEARHRPSVAIPIHIHEDHAYFSLVLRGGYTERSQKSVLDLKPSTLIFHPVGAQHANEFYPLKSHLFAVKLRANWLDQAREHGAILNQRMVLDRGPLIRLANKLYQEFCQADHTSTLMLEGLVMELVAEAARSSNGRGRSRPSWLAQAREMVHDQFNENLSLSHFAKSVGVHPVHFGRVFREHFGSTVGEYVEKLRVEFACRRLSSSDTSLVAIAVECGFCDQSHFCRTFKRLIGMTATEYRRLFRSC